MKMHKRNHVRNLTLPPRAVEALDRAGINTIGKLTRESPQRLLSIDGFGKSALEQTRIALKKAGHQLSA